MDPGLAIEPLGNGVLARLRGLAAQPRIDSIRCRTAVGSGHPTSAMSAAGLTADQEGWHGRPLPPEAADRAIAELGGEAGNSAYAREFAKANPGAVREAVADRNQTPGIAHLPVRDPPGSGRPQEVQDAAGITAPHLVTTAHALLN